ncbi:hypothetical protein BFW87_25175 [Pseudomonas fluorescens]|uniref:Uncharacterized protein n=1 Tax=Pseudomonas fluorescens TaxID=294 RepID=A0A1T2Y1Y9_PSEFL|nr:hypothetical protein [Pseudomonas fluorescens]OPA86053.1 hypothetical protein BFW87_25175 [Pseudomonas fluorescens]
MHSLFFATARVINGQVQPLDSIEKLHGSRGLSLEWQARLAIALSVCALGGCGVLWLLGV